MAASLLSCDTTDVESLSNDELRNKVQELKNVELSENKDWNDDLKVSCGIYTSTMRPVTS